MVDVAVYAEDGAAVDEDLGEDVEDRVVDFARRWKHKGDECHDDATGEKDDGCPFLDSRPLPTSPYMGGVRLWGILIHRTSILRLEANPT